MPDQASDAGYKGTHSAVVAKGSALRRYQDVVVGSRSTGLTLYYEWCVAVGALPGALGMLMRKIFWPRLFRACGKGTVFGSGVILRHPRRISLGQRVIVSDGVVLDARNEADDRAILIGDDTILSNNVMLSCKDGTLQVGSDVGLGAQTVVHAVNGAAVRIGDGSKIGPMCYIAGGGNYRMDKPRVPATKQGLEPGGDVEIQDDVWLGAQVTLLPSVVVESGGVVAAGSIVKKRVPSLEVWGGVVAKPIRRMEGNDPGTPLDATD